MFTRTAVLGACVLAVTVALGPTRATAQGQGDDRIYRALSTDQLEEMLGGFDVKFKRTENSSVRGMYYYDFRRDNYNMRLTSFDGKDLMIDNVFKAMSLDKVNEWNRKAKFSRASLHKDNKGDFVMLEFNLDVIGGVTKGAVRQLITQFGTECKNFDRFVGGSGGGVNPNPNPVVPVAGDKILLPLSDDAVAQVLRGLNVQFQQKGLPNNATGFDFKMDGVSLRLTNFAGKDIMIDAVFRKADLAAINKYNLDRKFIRVVAYPGNGNPYTALEANLDCAAGVSEAMVRHFVTAFVQDAKHFAKYLDNQQ